MNIRQHSYSDVIATRAWRDDDDMDDEDGGWRIEHLWFYSNGKRSSYTTCDCDGNHEPCSKRDADSFCADETASWDEYNAWAAEHGKDPLGNFMVEHETTRIEKWLVCLGKWVGQDQHGLAVLWARPRGCNWHRYAPGSFPKHVEEVVMSEQAGGRWVIPGYTDPKPDGDLITRVTKGATYYTVHLNVPVKTPRPAADIAADIRRIVADKGGAS